MPDSSLLAAGIVNLPMLGWLAAAAAPILIHLWSRQKHQEMSWAAMEYLLAAMRRQTRRMQFEQWLLLALRTLLVVLLVLAVAEPYLETVGLALTGGARTHRVLVVDDSYSMGYRRGDKSGFERAKEIAEKIVEESRQGDAFTLVVMAAARRVVVGTPALERGEILQEIADLQRTDGAANLPATVAEVQQVLSTARRENPGLAAHEVYFLTDLQRTTWDPRLSPAGAAQFRQQRKALAESAGVLLIDLGQPDAENLAITDVRALEPIVTLAGETQVSVDLKNFGREARSRQPVELLVDGRRVGQQQVDLAAGGDASVDFSYRFALAGEHALEVRADGDALAVDNRRWLAVPVRQSLRALCINGRPSGETFGGASDYLAYALAPQPEAAGRSLVEADVAAESALLERDLGRYDCIFFCDVAQFTAGEVRVLKSYLDSGGAAVFFLGQNVMAERYNREMAQGSDAVLPARLGDVVSTKITLVDPLGYRHPIVRAFRGREKAGLSNTPVFKYFKLQVPKDSAAEVVLGTAEGNPLMVEKAFGRGRVVLVATSADTSWTAAPILPGYVPLVQELVAFCPGGQLQQQNVRVGEPISASVPLQTTDAPATVQTPDGGTRPLAPEPQGNYSTATYADTSTSGVYTIRFDRSADRSETFAVNVDATESDLAPLPVDELRSNVWPGVPFEHQTTWQNLGAAGAGGRVARQGRLHVDLLYVVLALLFVESYLAWRFGHHAA